MELKEKKSIMKTLEKLRECVVEFRDISDEFMKNEENEHYGQMLDIGICVLMGIYSELNDIFDPQD